MRTRAVFQELNRPNPLLQALLAFLGSPEQDGRLSRSDRDYEWAEYNLPFALLSIQTETPPAAPASTGFFKNVHA